MPFGSEGPTAHQMGVRLSVQKLGPGHFREPWDVNSGPRRSHPTHIAYWLHGTPRWGRGWALTGLLESMMDISIDKYSAQMLIFLQIKYLS